MGTINRTLTQRIVIAMLLGALLGIALNSMAEGLWLKAVLVDDVFAPVGKIFIICLKMLVVPLVLVSLVCGVSSMSDLNTLGRVGFKTLGLYLLTTAIAITIAMTLAIIVSPGEGFERTAEAAAFSAKEAPSLKEVLINIFPGNPFKALVEGNMLQVIFFSLLLGIAIALSGAAGKRVAGIFEDLNTVVMKMVLMLMNVAPYGVFCLIAKVFATQGFDAIVPLLGYFMVVLMALAIHLFLTYPSLLVMLAGLNPITFFRKIRSAMMFAFSTASSSATIPVTLQTVEHRMGAKNEIASFTIPLGATINMDGTAIMQGAATVFIAQVYQVDISLMGYLQVILTATLASIGTAGVPGVGLIMLAMVLQQVGLPVEGIALIIGIDRLLDMARTAVNIAGDTTVTCIVAKSEQAFDEAIYTDSEAGIIIDGDEVPKKALVTES